MNNYGNMKFVKGVGVGMVAGATIAAMFSQPKETKRNAARFIRCMGDIAEHIGDFF